MLARPRTRPATYADLEALPPTMVGQILFGALHAHPRPRKGTHAAASRLGGEIDGPCDQGCRVLSADASHEILVA